MRTWRQRVLNLLPMVALTGATLALARWTDVGEALGPAIAVLAVLPILAAPFVSLRRRRRGHEQVGTGHDDGGMS